MDISHRPGGTTSPELGLQPEFSPAIWRAHRVAAAFDAGTCYITTYNDAPVEVL